MARAPSKYRFDPAQALRDFQEGADIPRPNLVTQQIPVVGSAWQALGDLQDGNYGSAAFNAGMAIAEATPVGAAVRGAKTLKLGGELLQVAPKATSVVKRMRAEGLTGPGLEVHHAIPIRGKPRNLPDMRNHPLLLKPLPTAVHRRVHGSWKGEPRFDSAQRIWYGTTATMKTVPLGLLGYTASTVENTQRASAGRANPQLPAQAKPVSSRRP